MQAPDNGKAGSDGEPVRAYSYVRMSTRKQLRGDSLRRQLERSRAFADEHGLLLDESLQDLGVSAWKGKNFKTGALGRFLAMVESGEIPRGSYLLIESLDRLSRDAVPDALTLFMEIINAGIIIATLGDDKQVYSRDGLKGDWTKLIIGLAVMSRGHEESQTKSERIGQANARKREKARRGEGKFTGQVPAWIDVERRDGRITAFALNDHAKTVRAIYEMAARGLGSTAIAVKLNSDNVPTFKSSEGWYPSIIKHILKRQDVLGQFQPHRMIDGKRMADGDPIDGYFPAVIEPALYLRVQAVRKRTGHGGRRGRTFANLFSGLCSCAHCGGPMTMKRNRLSCGYQPYLACSNHARGHRCTDGNRNFRYEPIEQAILDHVPELNLAESLRAKQRQASTDEIDAAIAALTMEIEAVRRREQRLLAALEDETNAIDSVISQLKARQEQRQALERELQHQTRTRAIMVAGAHITAEDIDHIHELQQAWEATSDDGTRYRLRAEAHAAIRELITDICFDSADTSAIVVVGNGVIALRIAGEGVARAVMWTGPP